MRGKEQGRMEEYCNGCSGTEKWEQENVKRGRWGHQEFVLTGFGAGG